MTKQPKQPTQTKQLMTGIDLHGNNLVIGIIDQDGQRLKCQKLACDLKLVATFPRRWRASWPRRPGM